MLKSSFYSLAILLVSGLGGHVYFEISAVIITLIKLGKLLEARTEGKPAVVDIVPLYPDITNVLGLISVSDTVKPESARAIKISRKTLRTIRQNSKPI